MAEAQSPENSSSRLQKMLDEALRLYYEIENSTHPSNGEVVQGYVRQGIEICEEATRMVSYAGIFSGSEGLSDMATADMQYLLLPVLLGRFTSQIVSNERKDLIRITEIYYRDFLQRTNDYGLSNYVFEQESGEDKEEEKKGKQKSTARIVTDACKHREMKLKQYDDKKKYQTLVTDLKKRLDSADDSTKREYYVNLIQFFICIAIEELNFLNMEKEMLEQMEKLGVGALKQPEKRPPRKAPQAIIITKDMVQKAVYGAGYPSLPTLTVQEFYDGRVRDGVFPDPNKPRAGPMNLQEAALAGVSLDDKKEEEDEEEESKIEKDDDEHLKSKRDEDDYKDDHRRGWGNRANRS